MMVRCKRHVCLFKGLGISGLSQQSCTRNPRNRKMVPLNRNESRNPPTAPVELSCTRKFPPQQNCTRKCCLSTDLYTNMAITFDRTVHENAVRSVQNKASHFVHSYGALFRSFPHRYKKTISGDLSTHYKTTHQSAFTTSFL